MGYQEFPEHDEMRRERQRAVNALFNSIAKEETGLAHLIEAESEKVIRGICLAKSIEDLLLINQSVERMLRNIIKKEMLLQFKLEDTMSIES